MWRKARLLLEMIKFEHSVFALPIAVSSALYATGGAVRWGPFAWVVAAMVSARSAAMAFNRIADAALDAKNPRTKNRHLPAGTVRLREAWIFTLAMAGAFVFSAGMLNATCLACSPGVLVILLGYSLTKRFTWLCHFVLGLSLGLAPLGAWIAIREEFDLFPILLSALVLTWVAGFDIIYATLDEDFDRREGLRSIPARFGTRAALIVSAACHIVTAGLLVAIYFNNRLGPLYLAWSAIVAVILAWEHFLVTPGNLQKAGTALFEGNALVSLGVMAALLLDLYNRGA